MYFSVWSKAACLWSAGFADLTWSWKLQTLKHEMCNRFRVKLCLIQPEKTYNHPPMTPLHYEWTLVPPQRRKKTWRYLLCKRFSSALLQRRCQSQKKNGRLFICRLWNWLYRGKKHFAHFQRSTLQPISTASSVNICIYSPSPSPTFQ